MHIAVIGSGISGLSAAWLLSQKHVVDLYEKDDRLGGHANTQTIATQDATIAVDTGFIVYNEATYPNLTALFDHLGVETDATDMSFAVSMNGGEQEYAGSSLGSLFARSSNLLRPSFLKMLLDIRRFYKEARIDAKKPDYQTTTLGHYLDHKNYSQTFCEDHLLPMGAAIWSMPADQMLQFPFTSFIRFCDNHGLLQIKDRPKWRTVTKGSQNYVARLAKQISGNIKLNAQIDQIERHPGAVTVHLKNGDANKYDQIILACHSDQALRLLRTDPDTLTQDEAEILDNLRYQSNIAVLHRDTSLMPKRKKVWAAWNYLKETQEDASKLCVSYWMNRLQKLDTKEDIIVTLNPIHQPNAGDIFRTYRYSHPIFNRAALKAQRDIWHIQGHNRTWFCGAYLGHGFHEDGLQAGLEIAERLGEVKRPWTVKNHSDRLYLPTQEPKQQEAAE
ncbi:MAG: FAD-dependent oxidoreductase [Cohaesibacter sp.]|nr:FAD-dependent oxidoreductase [Cohaesibacter sp.]